MRRPKLNAGPGLAVGIAFAMSQRRKSVGRVGADRRLLEQIGDICRESLARGRFMNARSIHEEG